MAHTITRRASRSRDLRPEQPGIGKCPHSSSCVIAIYRESRDRRDDGCENSGLSLMPLEYRRAVYHSVPHSPPPRPSQPPKLRSRPQLRMTKSLATRTAAKPDGRALRIRGDSYEVPFRRDCGPGPSRLRSCAIRTSSKRGRRPLCRFQDHVTVWRGIGSTDNSNYLRDATLET